MNIGVPKEIKDQEYRVAVTPAGAAVLREAGHSVIVEAGAGEGSGFLDKDYAAAGATIVPDARSVYQQTELVVKVKEPVPQEYPFLRDGLTLFCFLHLAAAEALAKVLLEQKATGIAYETVELADGRLPLLAPMSEIAGRLAIQVGAHFLEKPHGGRGRLLGGVAGVPPARVAILGAGMVGSSAAQVALGMGARVTLFDTNQERLRTLSMTLHGNLETMYPNLATIAETIKETHLLVGAVLVPGAKAPHLVTREMVSTMKPGAVVVDVAVDQGGSVATSHPTTHSAPTFVVDGVIHYCVSNMPAAVPRTATYALSNVTLPLILELANKGFATAVAENPTLAKGVNTYQGKLTHAAVARSLGISYTPLSPLLSAEETVAPS